MTDLIAIIGAGVAGLACARRLVGAGHNVIVLDKSRGVGGRLSTRRVETVLGPAQFDHGAQYFTVRDAGFASVVADLRAEGFVTPFDAPIRGVDDARARYVGAPGMSAAARGLARNLDLRCGFEVTHVRRHDETWMVTAADGAVVRAAALVVATPAEQARRLTPQTTTALDKTARDAVTAPCWAGMFVFEGGSAPFQAARLKDHAVLSWIVDERAKAGRPELAAFTVHATPAWSRANLELSSGSIAALLLEALRGVAPALGACVFQQAHRWRFAQVETPAGAPASFDRKQKIGLCGDWRLGARVEAAWLSGDALGAEMATW